MATQVQPVDDATLAYVNSSVEVALRPGAESEVGGGSAVLGVLPVSLLRIAFGAAAGGRAARTAERLGQSEHAAVAQLQIGAAAAFDATLAAIAGAAPRGSLRVQKLRALGREAAGEAAAADAAYAAIAAADETYAPALKRRVALLAAHRDSRPDAVALLVAYLDAFHADLEAWLFLAHLALAQRLVQLAVFALEEAVLLAPFNFLLQIRLAELLLATNSPALAVKYFCSALEISVLVGGHLRAWYGLKSATQSLIDDPASADSNPDSNDWAALNSLANERIAKIYASPKAAPTSARVVERWLSE
ncbi:hypothetical protein HK100_005889 [Physocladia obscura]|uniref:ER membrane protein complex subunit 2 n=1 Tax=Physocladia obscura TaxID=109957 RepID=A0AAD5SWS4_9FUNG|nr:hypothetical protein HK100_005889 [Physocladia obscura]